MFMRTWIDKNLVIDGIIQPLTDEKMLNFVKSYQYWAQRWLIHSNDNTEMWWNTVMNHAFYE